MTRTFLLALLLGTAQAASPSLPPPAPPIQAAGEAAVAGHAQGAFDSLNSSFGGAKGGGLAYSPDGRTLFTLDATRVLWRWDAGSGRALGSQVLKVPASLPGAGDPYQPRLILEGTRGGLLLRADGYVQARPYTARFTLEPQTGRTVLGDACPTSRTQMQTCTADGAVRASFSGSEAKRTVTLRRGQDAREVTLPGGGQPVALALSGDGLTLAALLINPTQTWDEQGRGRIHLVDVRDGKLTRTLAVPGSTRPEEASLRWAGQDLLTALAVQQEKQGGPLPGQVVTLWDTGTGTARWTLPPRLGLRGAEPSPDGQSFVSIREGSLPEARRVLDARFLRALGQTVTAFAPLPGGRALVSLGTGANGGGLAVLDRRGETRRLGAASGRSRRVAATRDASALASAWEGRVRLHTASGVERAAFEVPGFVQALAFSPDGKILSAHVTASPHGYGAGGADRVQTFAWRVDTLQPVSLPTPPQGSHYGLPVGETLRREDRRRLRATGPGDVRLLTLTREGKVRWETPWQPDQVAWFPTPDGRALIRTQGIFFPRSERSGLQLQRMDARTGKAGPALTLPPNSPDVYASVGVWDVAPDRRHVLLGEWSGDGCGWGFLGTRLADLGSGREVALPTALASGLNRDGGCGYPVPMPQAAFSPDGRWLLLKDGNTVNWWAGEFGVARP